jgi:hypothetical protein
MSRYVVRESSGYTAGSHPAWFTEVLVMDSWYVYAVVWSSARTFYRRQIYRRNGQKTGLRWRRWSRISLRKRREYAAHLAAELNREHDAAMLAPMQAALAGEDVQAREGKAS